ncbi:protein sax-3-like [Clytia hemisphaerica]|uniref:protein sax-3-like n=1 Tax=Clytia hemisphaerica TaxID=252671 RepID=UPI0034D61938
MLLVELISNSFRQGPPGPPGPEGPKGLGLEKPTLVQNTLDKGVVNLTDSKIFECKFFGSPIPEVSWKSPKSQFIINDTIDKESSTITSRLILTNISWYDQGPVKCNAKSLLGEDSGYGNLSTLSKPVISMNKKLVFAPERINFTFPECKVRSNPTAKVTWKRIFWSMPAGRVHVRENTLTINHVQYSDEGFYVCEADNFLGKDKKTIQLKIKPFEMHQTSASKIYIPSGENATISCSAYGNNHEMTGTITKSGEKISSKEEQKTGNLFEVKANVTSEGTYLCTIENRKEKAESATLVKHFKLSSSLLSSAQQSLVGRELRKINKIGKYKKCFGLSLPSTTFYTSCGGKKDTITFFRIKDMYKRNRYGSRYYAWGSRYIGGFTDLPWQKDNQMEYSNLTALFDLSNQRIYPSIEGREAVCYHDGYGPCFGNKDLYVASDGKIYRSSLGSSFNPKPTFNQKEVQFETFYLM